jgi:hypothetical protein
MYKKYLLYTHFMLFIKNTTLGALNHQCKISVPSGAHLSGTGNGELEVTELLGVQGYSSATLSPGGI